jgi:hypothetical protein
LPVRDAHERADTQELQRIYDYARWCFHQKAVALWNAAAVAFYEHLVDEPTTRGQIPRWLQPDVFDGCRGLFEARLEPEQFRELCERYSRRHETHATDNAATNLAIVLWWQLMPSRVKALSLGR